MAPNTALSTESISEYVGELQTLTVSDVEQKAKALAKNGIYTFAAAFVISAKSAPINVGHLGDTKAALASAAIAAAHVTVSALEPAIKAAIRSLRETSKARYQAAQASRQTAKVAKARAVIAAAEAPAA